MTWHWWKCAISLTDFLVFHIWNSAWLRPSGANSLCFLVIRHPSLRDANWQKSLRRKWSDSLNTIRAEILQILHFKIDRQTGSFIQSTPFKIFHESSLCSIKQHILFHLNWICLQENACSKERILVQWFRQGIWGHVVNHSWICYSESFARCNWTILLEASTTQCEKIVNYHRWKWCTFDCRATFWTSMWQLASDLWNQSQFSKCRSNDRDTKIDHFHSRERLLIWDCWFWVKDEQKMLWVETNRMITSFLKQRTNIQWSLAEAPSLLRENLINKNQRVCLSAALCLGKKHNTGLFRCSIRHRCAKVRALAKKVS
jgi:hypothetical protein